MTIIHLYRLYAYLFFIGIHTITLTDDCTVPITEFTMHPADDCTVPITDFSHKVQTRFYFIERLKNTIEILNEINNAIPTDQCTFIHSTNEFARFNKKKMHQKKNQTKTLKPLFHLWEDFSIYKKLDDDLFVEEFTKEIFVIVKLKLFNELSKKKLLTKSLTNHFNFTKYISIDTRVNLIAAMSNFLSNNSSLNQLNDEIKEILTIQKNFDDIPKNIESEHILQRLYHIERLRNQTTFLQCFKQLNVNIFKNANAKRKKSSKREFDDQIMFQNNHIQITIKEMVRTNSLDPLIKLLENFSEFVYINNTEFIRETLITLFITQKNILINHLQLRKDRSVITQIIQLYNIINSLPIEEILNAIDTLTETLEDIAQEIENNSSATNWWSKPYNTIMYVLNMITTYRS